MAADNALTLYLSSWQKRMVRDFVDKKQCPKIKIADISKVKIKNIKVICGASYKIPVDGIRKRDWILYLTDEQIAMVQEVLKLRVPLASLNITEEVVEKGMIAFA